MILNEVLLLAGYITDRFPEASDPEHKFSKGAEQFDDLTMLCIEYKG
jgi:hypothetical protein